MDTHKISFQKLIAVVAVIWVVVLIMAFLGFTQKFSFGQLIKDIFLKHQKLPLLVMAQNDNKSLGETGFTGGRVIAANQDAFVFIGPYWPLLPGEYEARWEIVPDCAGRLGQIDVVSRLAGTEYGKVDVVGERAGESQTSTIDFMGDFSWNYEFRFYAKNACGFKVIKAELVHQKIDWKSLFNQTIGKFQ